MDEIDKVTTLLCKAEDEIEQWKRVVVAHVEEIQQLKAEKERLLGTLLNTIAKTEG